MNQEKIDKYFAGKGIHVRFNTLGYDKTLVYSYVDEFNLLTKLSANKKSNDIKFECYNKLYNFESRVKLTGFENISLEDKNFRRIINQYIKESQFTPCLYLGTDDIFSQTEDYKTVLKNSLSNLDNTLLYLSGGLDSELVANALLDSNKPFTPVIFFYVDNHNTILNSKDTDFAIRFCKKHNLQPITKTINLSTLWASDEFKELAIDTQISSTHLVTYCYMVTCINKEYPNKTHLFGGEVRFYNKFINNKETNIVFLNKVCPPAYNGDSVIGQSPGNSRLLYYQDGTYQIGRTNGATLSGTWTTTPSNYEYLINAVTITDNFGLGSVIPNAPTTWESLGLSDPTQICRVNGTQTTSNWRAVFEIWVRAEGDTTNICISGLELAAEGTA